jgi:hypothetical protein
MLRFLVDKVRTWYGGEWKPYENPPGSAVVFMGVGANERHWTAKVARVLIRFWLAHWQWIIGAAIAVAGLLLRVAGKV